MNYWKNNEDAGDPYLMGLAFASEAQEEARLDGCRRDWEAYRELWKQWGYDGEPSSCEVCDVPMNAENCTESVYGWHCGCCEAE